MNDDMRIVLVSVGRGPLTGLFERWWVTVDVEGDGIATSRCRLEVEWSPWTNGFHVPPESVEIVAVGSGPAAPRPEEVVDAFVHSPALQESLDRIKAFAHRYQAALPARARGLLASK